MKLAIVAIGNPVREDDAVAWRIAEALAQEDPELTVIRAPGLFPDLVAELEGLGGVIFVDARDGGEPGTVTVERLTPAAEAGGLSHAMSPPSLLALAERLHGRAPRAALVAVSGAHFDFGEELSEPVADAVPTAVRCILRLADDWIAESA